MKNITIKTVAFFLIFTTSSCYNYEEQYDGEYEDSTTDEEVVIPKEVVFVAGGDVYLANQFVEDIIKIDETGTVEVASINNEHTKIIFKRSGENIQVYDIASETITEEIPDTETATWFDYHKNNETVYHLSAGGILKTVGPEVLTNNSIINLNNLSIIDGSTRGAVILENGNIIFSVEGNAFDTNRIFISDGSEILVSRATNFFYRKDMRLNEEENILWAGHENDYSVGFYRTSDLFQENDEDTNSYLGVPKNADSGYKVNENNEIITPNFQRIQSPNGEITSIDY